LSRESRNFIQFFALTGTGWTAPPPDGTVLRMRRPPPPIDKLSDQFGDYVLTVKCRRCQHTRTTDPITTPPQNLYSISRAAAEYKQLA
jgi:hypothetical protein